MAPKTDFYGCPVSVGTACTRDEGRTVQQDAESADINKILRRAGITDPRQLPLPQGQVFLDVSQFGDYMQLQARVIEGKTFFESFAPEIRAKFDNDPLRFLEVLADPDQRDSLVELGIVEAPKDVVPDGGTGAPADGAAASK